MSKAYDCVNTEPNRVKDVTAADQLAVAAVGCSHNAERAVLIASLRWRPCLQHQETHEHDVTHLVPVLHKVDALVHISKQNEGLDDIEAADEHGGVKKGCPEQSAAGPLMDL